MGMTNPITAATLDLSIAFDNWMDDQESEEAIHDLQANVDILDSLIRDIEGFMQNTEARIAHNFILLINRIAEDTIG